MRVYKTKWFQRFARRERIKDEQLCEAVSRAAGGRIDADLGAGLIKQRLARPGSGRSGGYRTLLFFRAAERAVFAFAFAKNDRDNLGEDDESELKKAAKITLAFSQTEVDRLVAAGSLIEVGYEVRNNRENLPQ